MPDFPAKTDPAPVWRRFGMGVAVAALVWGIWVACQHLPIVWLALGIGQSRQPFVDFFNVLAANDAYWAGLNPFVPLEWDPYHRPFLYSEWWFALGWFGLGRRDIVWVGYLLGALVLLTSLGMARPRAPREWVYLVLLLVSPAWLLSFTRANNDPVVFVLMSLGLCCYRSERWPPRVLGILLFAACVGLKYYPLVTLVVLLDARNRRELVASLALYSAILVIAWPAMEQGWKAAARYAPGPSWLYAFGAPTVLRNFETDSRLAWLVPAVGLALWALGMTWRQGRRLPVATGATPADEREFLCGASLLVGLFFLGASYVYKLIFAVWMLPWLWRIATTPGPERRWARRTLGLLLAVACLDGWGAVGLNLGLARWSMPAARTGLEIILTLTQLLTWGLVVCLLRLLPVVAAPRLFRLWSGRRAGPGGKENGLPVGAA